MHQQEEIPTLPLICIASVRYLVPKSEPGEFFTSEYVGNAHMQLMLVSVPSSLCWLGPQVQTLSI